MALSQAELDLIAELERELNRTRKQDLLLWRYYRGQQQVEQLGMAIPPDMRRFLVITNWPRVVVDTLSARQQVRALILPGEENADPILRAIWDANNMTAHLKMFNRDRMVYGRAFLSVGANEDNPALPFVRVESPTSMAALVDIRTETMRAAGRFYRPKGSLSKTPTSVTLYLPNETIYVEKGQKGWQEIANQPRDEHGMGAVPIIMHLNRRMSGEWQGESEMTDIIPVTDSAVRALTNMQFAQESHGIPRMWMVGVNKDDFVEKDGEPIPQWMAYFDRIHTLTNKDASIGQLMAADLSNFETSLRIYGQQAAIVTGFPARYFGLTTANPPSADAIRADEAELVRSAEDQDEEVGMSLGWTGALAYRFSTGNVVEGNKVQVDWFDPATPTIAQREDALAKRRASGVLSRRGYWTELGWSDARIKQEEAWMAEEAAADPELSLARQLASSNAPA